MTRAPTFGSSSAFFRASHNSMTKAEFKAFNAFGRFNVMSSTPGSGLEIKRFSYWLVPVVMVRTVKLSREKEEVAESRDLVAREETRNGAFKSENENLRAMSPDFCVWGIISSLAPPELGREPIRRPGGPGRDSGFEPRGKSAYGADMRKTTTTRKRSQSVARSKNPGPIFFNLVLNPSYHLTIALIGTNVFSSTAADPIKLEIKLSRCFTTCSARRPGSGTLVAATTTRFPLALPGSGSVGAIWDKGSIAIPRIAVTSPPTVGLTPPANATGTALAPGVKAPRNRKMADGLSFESLARG